MRDFIKVDRSTTLVDGLLQSGALYTLTAKRGHNKTAFCTNLALALAYNRSDLIGKDIEPSRVLYMTAENPEMLKRRLRLSLVKFDINLDQFPEESLCAVGGFLKPEEMLAECKEMMQAAEREGETFGLVIVDTLQAYFTGDDSNSNAQVVGFLRCLRPITELKHKPTVLIPAHPTKNAGEDALVPYGGGGILNEIDGNLTISMTENIAALHYQDKLCGVHFEPVIFKSTLETEITDQRGRLVELRTPERVRQAHVADQLTNFERHFWPANSRARLPSPEQAKPGTMPADDCLRLDDHQGFQNVRCEPIEAAKNDAIKIVDGGPLWRFSLQHIELVAKYQDLGLEIPWRGG